MDQMDWTSDERTLYARIPADGTFVGNTRLRDALGWDINRYWSTRDSLIERGVIGIGRGRGGSVFRVEHSRENEWEQESEVTDFAPSLTERSLYEPFQTSIEKWANDLKIGEFFTEITAFQGRRNTGGRWTRPDLTLISVGKYHFFPGAVLDVWTFEVKFLNDAVLGVFEAAAQSRIATKSYLAVCVHDSDAQGGEILARARAECDRFGIGLITFEDPAEFETFDFVLEAERRNPDPAEIDQFVSQQISENGQRKLQLWLR